VETKQPPSKQVSKTSTGTPVEANQPRSKQVSKTSTGTPVEANQPQSKQVSITSTGTPVETNQTQTEQTSITSTDPSRRPDTPGTGHPVEGAPATAQPSLEPASTSSSAKTNQPQPRLATPPKMTFYASQLSDRTHSNRARKARTREAITKLGLQELWEKEGALHVTHTLAKMAERYKMTYRKLSVALMESLPEEWRERIDPLLESMTFVVTKDKFDAQDEEFFPNSGTLKRCKFLQNYPINRADFDKRGPTTWSRLMDIQTQIYPEDLEHENEVVTKTAGEDATSAALNDSFGTFSSSFSGTSPNSGGSGSSSSVPSKDKFPEGVSYNCSMNQDEQRWRFIIWAVAKTEYEITLSLQLPRLEEKIAKLDRTASQETKIKEVKRLLKLGHLASLMDTYTFLKDPDQILEAKAEDTQLDRTAFRLLKDSMTPEQKSNLNTFLFNRDMDSKQDTIQDLKHLLVFEESLDFFDLIFLRGCSVELRDFIL
jgi:hypothetical protein